MKRNPDICIRVNEDEFKIIKENMIKFKFHTLSEYIRFVAVNTKEINIKTNPK